MAIETSPWQAVTIFWLYVVKERQVEKVAFAPADLIRTPVISVDGYVNGMVLLGAGRLNLLVDGSPIRPLRRNPDGTIRLEHFGSLSGDEFMSAFWPSAYRRTPAKPLQGCYASFAKVPGDALSEKPELRITLARAGIPYSLTIHQLSSVKLAAPCVAGAPPLAPDICYLGSDSEQFEKAPERFEQRMQAILTGIQAIEVAVGAKIVERVHFIDYDGRKNAYTLRDAHDIWFYPGVFWNESLDELKIMAEHETMHILADRLGLPTRSGMRRLFADLMGFGKLSRERFAVITTGRPPEPERPHAAAKADKLFDFINESHFFDGMNGGHSQDDLDEFCASFLHTLMYVDRLDAVLHRPLNARSGHPRVLSGADQAQLLDDYQSVLTAMMDNSPTSLTEQMKAFFRRRCDAVNRVITTFQAGLAGKTPAS